MPGQGGDAQQQRPQQQRQPGGDKGKGKRTGSGSGLAEAGTCCCVVRVAGQVTSTHLQNEYHGTQVRQQCVTIPLACYPCLSCSKHHARCMWAGCLDLTKLCAGPSAVCLSHTGFVRSRQPSLIRTGFARSRRPSLIRTGFARSRWPSLIRTACRVLLNKTGAGHRYGTRQRTRSPSHGHVYCLVATITWPCVLPGCDHPMAMCIAWLRPSHG